MYKLRPIGLLETLIAGMQDGQVRVGLRKGGGRRTTFGKGGGRRTYLQYRRAECKGMAVNSRILSVKRGVKKNEGDFEGAVARKEESCL